MSNPPRFQFNMSDPSTCFPTARQDCGWPDAADRLDRTERQLLNEDRPAWSGALRDRIYPERTHEDRQRFVAFGLIRL